MEVQAASPMSCGNIIVQNTGEMGARSFKTTTKGEPAYRWQGFRWVRTPRDAPGAIFLGSPLYGRADVLDPFRGAPCANEARVSERESSRRCTPRGGQEWSADPSSSIR